jgi:hypothetical protein
MLGHQLRQEQRVQVVAGGHAEGVVAVCGSKPRTSVNSTSAARRMLALGSIMRSAGIRGHHAGA